MLHCDQVPDVCAKFHDNWLKIATVRAQTDRHTHRDDREWSYNLSHAMGYLYSDQCKWRNANEVGVRGRPASRVEEVDLSRLGPSKWGRVGL